MATHKSQFETRSANAKRIHVSAKDEEISGQPQVSKKPLMLDNVTRALAGRAKSEKVMRAGAAKADNSRLLKLASIAQYVAKHRIAAAEKRVGEMLASCTEQ